MKSRFIKILSLLFAILMIFQHVALATSTVDLFTDEELKPETKTQDIVSPSVPKAVDILDESPKTVDILNPESYVGEEKEETKVKPNENVAPKTGTIDIITDHESSSTEIEIPEASKETDSKDGFGDNLVNISDFNEEKNFDENRDETVDLENNEEVDYNNHENAGTLPWSTDLTKPWSLYRAPKKVYRPGDDLDLSELLVEIKTGRSGSLYNIADILDDEFAKIYRVKKSDGSNVELSDKIMEDEILTIHMDGCEDIKIELSVDENLNVEEGYEAFQYNLISAIRESLNDRLDFSLYVIGKGKAESPKIAYSLDPLKMSPLGKGEEGSLTEGELYNKKNIVAWDRYDKDTLGKVKNILIRSDEFKDKDSIRYKLVTQLAIWNITSNLLPEEIVRDKETEINDETNIDETPEETPKTNDVLDKILESSTLESSTKDIAEDKTELTVDEKKTEIKSGELEDPKEVSKIEETEVNKEETNKDSEETTTEEKVESVKEKETNDTPVKETVKSIEFNTSEFDIPYDRVELTDEEYSLYKELIDAKPLDLDDEKFEIYEPEDMALSDLVTYGSTDIDKIQRIDKNITFDAVEYRFKNVYRPIESYSMIGFGQSDNFIIGLYSKIRASRDIKRGDKLTVKIESEYEPNQEESELNGLTLDGKVVATSVYDKDSREIIYTFNEDLNTNEVELNQEFIPIKNTDEEIDEKEDAAIYGMLEVGKKLIGDALRSANDENAELEISDLKLLVGKTELVGRARYGFENKKFRLVTTVKALASPVWKIPAGWTLDIKLGDYLKKGEDEILPIKDPDNGSEDIATGVYDEQNHTIRYTFTKAVSITKDLKIDQLLSFDMNSIGNKNSIDINVVVAPKNFKEQKMPIITVDKNDTREIIDSQFVVGKNEISSGEYPYILSYKANENFSGYDYKLSIDVDTKPILSENLNYNSIGISIYAPKNQGLSDYKIKINGIEGSFDESGKIVLSNKVINKDQLADKLNIEVTAKVKVKKNGYSFGLRITPDQNYIKALREELQSKIDKMGSVYGPLVYIIKYLKDPNNSSKFDQGFNLLDTRIATIAYPSEDRYVKIIGVNNDRLSFYPYEDGNGVVYKLSETIRLQDEESKFVDAVYNKQVENLTLLNDNPSVDVFIPNVDGSYETRSFDNIDKNSLVNELNKLSLIPGTIIEYNFNANSNNLKNDAIISINSFSASYRKAENQEGVYHIWNLVDNLNKPKIMKIEETGETVYCINPALPTPTNKNVVSGKVELVNGKELRGHLNLESAYTRDYERVLKNLKKVFFYRRQIEKESTYNREDPNEHLNLVLATQAAIYDAIKDNVEDNNESGERYLYGTVNNPEPGLISSFSDKDQNQIADYYKKMGNGRELTLEEENSVKITLYPTHNVDSKKNYQNVISGEVIDPVEIKKVDEYGNVLKNAKFMIRSLDNTISKEWTSEDAPVKLYLKPGNYEVEEVTAPQGYKKINNFNFSATRMVKSKKILVSRDEITKEINETKKVTNVHLENTNDVKLDNNKILISILNKKNNEFEIIKVDADDHSIKIAGVQFTLYKLDDNGNKILPGNIVTTDNDGKARFKNLEVGRYVLVETKTKDGYLNDKIEISIVVDNNGVHTNYVNPKNPKEDNDKPVDPNPDKPGEDPDKPVNPDPGPDKPGEDPDEPVNPNPDKPDEPKEIEYRYDRVETKNIRYSSDKFDNYNYRTEVIDASKNPVSRIYLNPSIVNGRSVGPKEDTFVDLIPGSGNITNIRVYSIAMDSKQNYMLNGRNFSDNDLIYHKVRDITEFVVNGNTIDLSSEKISQALLKISQKNKAFGGDGIIIQFSTAYGEDVIERTVSFNWHNKKNTTSIKDTVGVRKVAVHKNKENNLTFSYPMTFERVMAIRNEISDVDNNSNGILNIVVPNKKITNKVVLKKVDEEGNVLSGATFGLFSKDGKPVQFEGKNVEAISGEDGLAEFRDLAVGDYFIKETKAPLGYELSDKEYPLNVIKDKDGKFIIKSISTSIKNPNKERNIRYQAENGNYYDLMGIRTELKNTDEQNVYDLYIHYVRKYQYQYNDSAVFKLSLDKDNYEIIKDFDALYHDGFNVDTAILTDKLSPNNGYKDSAYHFRLKLKSKEIGKVINPIKFLSYAGLNIESEYLPSLTVVSENLTSTTEDGLRVFCFTVKNKQITRDVEFIKVGNLNECDCRLWGAEFELYVKNKDAFEKMNPEVKTTSDGYGKFSFKNLKPGDYQIVETKAPQGYRKVEGPIKEFRINLDGSIEVKNKDLYEPLNDENIKISNDKLGEGKFKVKKNDENGKPLSGVVFQLTDSHGNVLDTITTGSSGEIEFNNLPNGKYYLREIKTADGFVLDSREFPVFIGEKWKVPASTGEEKDVSSSFELVGEKSKLTSTKNSEEVVKPNESEGMKLDLTYKINNSENIKPGDYFTVKLSDNVDVDGIDVSPEEDFNIFGPSGLMAVAQIGNDRRTITYRFTDYVKYYTLSNVEISLTLYPNRITINSDQYIDVIASVGDSSFERKIFVQYSGYQRKDINLNAYMIKLNPQDNTFTAYVYINPWHEYSWNKYLDIYPNVNFKYFNAEVYRVKVDKLPDSYGVVFDSKQLERVNANVYDLNSGKQVQISSYNNDSYYLVKLTGKVENNTKTLTIKYLYNRTKRAFNYYYNAYFDYNYEDNWNTYSEFYYPSGKTDGSFNISNSKNKIEFTKVEGSIIATNSNDSDKPVGSVEGDENTKDIQHIPVFSGERKKLQGVKFKLKKDGTDIPNSEIVSDENGKLAWTGLSKGKYEVWEIETLKGYKLPNEAVSSFEVNENGEILNIKNNTTIIVNEKIDTDIEFSKVDSKDHKITLKDAEFTLFKQFDVDGNMSFDAVDMDGNKVDDIKNAYKVMSAEDGKIKFEKLKDGVYAVKETKAPKGYQKPSDYIYRFEVLDGEVYVLNEEFKRTTNTPINKENKDVYPINIENRKAEYPQTGGIGSIVFTIVGLSMMMIAVFVLKKREECYE